MRMPCEVLAVVCAGVSREPLSVRRPKDCTYFAPGIHAFHGGEDTRHHDRSSLRRTRSKKAATPASYSASVDSLVFIPSIFSGLLPVTL
jgi:hypothetical protein